MEQSSISFRKRNLKIEIESDDEQSYDKDDQDFLDETEDVRNTIKRTPRQRALRMLSKIKYVSTPPVVN